MSVFLFAGALADISSLSLGISTAVFSTPLGPYANVLGSVDGLSTGAGAAALDPMHMFKFPVIGGLGLNQEHFVSAVTCSYAIL